MNRQKKSLTHGILLVGAVTFLKERHLQVAVAD